MIADAKSLNGLYAALITPVNADGRPDEGALIRMIDFARRGGVDGLCIGGGTSEYPQFEIQNRKSIISCVARRLNGEAPFLTAIGAPTMRAVLELGRHAVEEGSQALLLPMPFFYRYAQEDLSQYARTAALSLRAPCLLYNLPEFTNPLEPGTALDLMRENPYIVGLKDSSGSRRVLALLAARREEPDASVLFCGSDGLILDALDAGWNGAISGIAGFAPEVLAALFRCVRARDRESARRCQQLVDELVELVNRLPFPWSIRAGFEARGLHTGPLHWPLTTSRESEMAALRDTYEQWFKTRSAGV